MFELKLNNKTIHLKWGTWAMREYCIVNNITLEKYFDFLKNAQTDLNVIIQLIYIGYKAACVSKKEEIIYTEVDVCEWVDELGSIFNIESPIKDYFQYIVDCTLVNVNGPKDTKDEKKKPNKTKLG